VGPLCWGCLQATSCWNGYRCRIFPLELSAAPVQPASNPIATPEPASVSTGSAKAPPLTWNIARGAFPRSVAEKESAGLCSPQKSPEMAGGSGSAAGERRARGLCWDGSGAAASASSSSLGGTAPVSAEGFGVHRIRCRRFSDIAVCEPLSHHPLQKGHSPKIPAVTRAVPGSPPSLSPVLSLV